MEAIKSKNLPVGDYTAVFFEPKQSKFTTPCYIITALDKDGNKIRFWSNSYISTYTK